MPGQVEAAMSRASHLVRAPYLRGKGPSGHGGSGSVHRPGPAGPCQEETIGLQPPPEWRGPGAGWCLPSPPSSPGLGGAPASFPPLGNPCLEGVASRTVLRPGVLPPGDPLASPPPSLPAGGGRPLLCGPLPSPLGGTAPSSLAPLPRLRAPSAQASPRCAALLPCVRPLPSAASDLSSPDTPISPNKTVPALLQAPSSWKGRETILQEVPGAPGLPTKALSPDSTQCPQSPPTPHSPLACHGEGGEKPW